MGLDQYVVAGLLAGTGPMQVRGVTVTSDNAVAFLSKDIYRLFPDVNDKDAVVGELVQDVFARLLIGEVDLRALVEGLKGPVSQRRLTGVVQPPAEEDRLPR